jgi:hypothetical protein
MSSGDTRTLGFGRSSPVSYRRRKAQRNYKRRDSRNQGSINSMARRKAGGASGTEITRSRSFKGFAYSHTWRGVPVTRGWPVKRGKPKSETTADQNSNWKRLMQSIKEIDADSRIAAQLLAEQTAYTYRDILIMCATGTYIEVLGLPEMDLQTQLDMITDQVGALLVRGPLRWIAIVPQPPGWVLTSAGPEDPGSYQPLPIATEDSLGLVQVDGTTIVIDDLGLVSATAAAVPIATDTALGRVKPDNDTITVNEFGVLSATFQEAPIATYTTPGIVKPDGTTITIGTDGLIAAVGSASGLRGLFSGDLSAVPTQTGTGFTTWRNQGSATVTDTGAGIYFTAPSNGSTQANRYLRRAAPSGDFTFRALCSVFAPTVSGFAAAIIGLSDGAKLWTLEAAIGPGGGNPILQSLRFSDDNTYTGVADYTQTARDLGSNCWLQIVKTSTKIEMSVSMDGTNFIPLVTTLTASWYLTPTHLAIGLRPFNLVTYATFSSIHVF